MRLWLVLASAGAGAAILAGVWLHGQRAGVAACEARHEAARRATEARLIQQAEGLSRRAQALAEAQADLIQRAREIEDEIRANPDSCRIPAADSLSRLRRRWGAD